MKRSLEQRIEKLEQAAEAREPAEPFKVRMATTGEWRLFYEAHPEEREKTCRKKNERISGFHIEFVYPEGSPENPDEMRSLAELETMYYGTNGGNL